MPNAKDYIPGPDAELDGWFLNLKNYVVEHTSLSPPAWDHIPPAKVTALVARYDAWHAAYEKTLGPHTAVDTEAKNDERKASHAFIRPFAAQYLMFDPVTNEDRTAMGLHNRDPSHTPIGKPATRALITELKPLGGFQVEIRFQDEASPGSRAIPYGCNGCLLSYAWGPEKITDRTALIHTQLMTHNLFVLSLPPEAEGKFFSAAVRWQNETGVLGAWSAILYTVIV